MEEINLANLLQSMIPLANAHDISVSDLTQDSRHVSAGSLFLAYPGLRVDGRDFISAAVAKGASAVLYENGDGYTADNSHNIPLIGIPNLETKIGLIASRFYGEPTKQMQVVGVTGTNGKTSITQFIAQALSLRQQKCAVIGTIGKGFLPDLHSTGYTTPDAVGLQRDLAECLKLGADSVAMEVSSHSLSQHRVVGVEFDVAVFSNLTRDHLDYHGTMAAYGAAKAALFQFPSLKYAIYNADDEFGRELIKQNPHAVQAIVYTTDSHYRSDHAVILAHCITPTQQGFNIEISTPWGNGVIRSNLLGRFNVSNLLAVLGVLGALKMPLTDILLALERLQPVKGRMQSFGGAAGKPLVIVDFAHSPDALLQVLTSLREHQPKRLWCVFGCGGDRDRGKRPQMGAIASQHCDYIIITNDNPRSESPEAIAAEIRVGIPLQSQCQVHIELDRQAAIAYAIAEAGPNDIVLIAGKGHETEQIIGSHAYPFSDVEVAQKLTE